MKGKICLNTQFWI